MLNTCIRIATCIFVATAVLAITEAHAVQRTFVASFGIDTNTAANCSLAAPCRGFAAALTVTDNNGEIIVLDSAGYGAVTITKSISIIAPTGVYAGISVFPGADGVTIATPGVDVVLRGLSINGQGGNVGIKMTAGNSLTVANSVVSNLMQGGIAVSGVAIVKITDTVVQRNRNSGILLQNGVRGTIIRTMVSGHINGDGFDGGIRVQGSIDNTTTTADIADSTFDGNRNGVLALAFAFGGTAVARVSVRDSRAVGNQVFGFRADSNFVSAVSLSVSNSLVSSNSIGIGGANAGVKVWASGNTVSENTGSGLFNSNGAVFESAGNNAVRNNGAINSGTITIVTTQ